MFLSHRAARFASSEGLVKVLSPHDADTLEFWNLDDADEDNQDDIGDETTEAEIAIRPLTMW